MKLFGKRKEKGKKRVQGKPGTKWRKRLISLILIISFIILIKDLVKSLSNFEDKKLRPEVERAVIQISKVLPQLLENEQALRDTYAVMEKSRRDAVRETRISAGSPEDDEEEESLEELVDETVSWMNHVSKFKVGRDGVVIVASKENGAIYAHPDDSLIGSKMAGGEFSSDLKTGAPIPELMDLKIDPDNSIPDLDIEILAPRDILTQFASTLDVTAVFENTLYGTVVSYKDLYIVCGIPLKEYLEDCLGMGLYISVIVFVLIWVYVKYVGLLLDAQRESGSELRFRLSNAAVILSVIIFFVSWYIQIISSVTNDIKTMDHHASVAADMLDVFEEQRQKINDWLDSQYLKQCRLAADYVTRVGSEKLTRASLQRFSDILGISHIYVFDKEGKVIVTNSPYDHFAISSNKGDQSYAFHPLLEGADHVIQPPSKDEITGESMQFVGVGLRDSDDLSNGFVQIAVKPDLRENLVQPLSVDSVLTYLVIGLPKYAVAINKNDLTITATSGLGYVGEPSRDLGISEENLVNNFNGFLRIDREGYYAGSAETEDLYLVPIVPKTRSIGIFRTSLTSAVISLLTMFLMMVVAVLNFRKKPKGVSPLPEETGDQKEPDGSEPVGGPGIDGGTDEQSENGAAGTDEQSENGAAGTDEQSENGAAGTDEQSENGAAGTDEQSENGAAGAEKQSEKELESAAEKAAENSTEASGGSRLLQLIRMQEKTNYDDRWKMKTVPVEQQTPEKRIGIIIYRLMLLVSVLLVLPHFWSKIYGPVDTNNLRGLSYVVSGNWEKGFNIFSFSLLFLLLCEMYVFVVLMSQFLYRLGKVTDMRTETICLLIKNSLKYICMIIFVFYGLSKFGVRTDTLWTSAGVLSVVIGFGAKDLMNDVISGFFIIFDGTFKVGDFVTIGSWYGTVQEIGLRTTRVSYFSDTKIISNSSIREVINADGNVAGLPMLVPVSYDDDLARIEGVLKEELPGLKGVIPGLLGLPEYQGVDSFQDSAIMLRILILVDRNDKMPAKRAFNREIKLIFDKHGIEIPYSQIVVHNASDGEKKEEKTES